LFFTGTFRHAIDAKGRLIVPSRIRAELGGNDVVLSLWLEGCIAIWSPEGWEEVVRSLRSLGRGGARARRLQRSVAGPAYPEQIDKQGRISVPVALREATGIERDVVVMGAFDHAEIWNPERHERATELEEGQLEELAEGLEF
jgi:MraZ protein